MRAHLIAKNLACEKRRWQKTPLAKNAVLV